MRQYIHSRALFSSTPGVLRGLRLVVVEDDPDSRELMAIFLSVAGADVVTAAHAEEGLSLVQRVRPHVLISDLGLPGQDGHELVRRLRRLPPLQGGQTPAIALSGATDPPRSSSAGFQTYLSKPCDVDLVIEAVVALGGGGPS